MRAVSFASQPHRGTCHVPGGSWTALGVLFHKRLRQDSPEQIEALRHAARALAVAAEESSSRVELDMTAVSPAACHRLDAATVAELVQLHAGKDVVLHLPQRLDRFPSWLWRIPHLIELSAVGYRSSIVVLQGLRRLSVVHLDRRVHERITVYRSGVQDMRMLDEGVALDGIDWRIREDPDEGLEDDSSDEALSAATDLPSFDADSDSDAESLDPTFDTPPASGRRMLGDGFGVEPPSPAATEAGRWRARELELHESTAGRARLPQGPFMTIRMGQGIVATGSLTVTTTALYSCCFMAGVNLGSGKAGAYHYPAGLLDDAWVLETMMSWLRELKPERVVLVFAPPSEREALDVQVELDSQAVCRWVHGQSGAEVELARMTTPVMRFREGRFEVGGFATLAREGFGWGDGADLHGMPSGSHVDERTGDVLSLFGVSMDS